MSDITERLRRIGNAGSTESRVALEAVQVIEFLTERLAEIGNLVHDAEWKVK